MKLAAALVLSLIATPALPAPITAIASFSIIGDMVSRVGGDRVEVRTIVGPNADTHVYEPRPADAAAVASADIFFINGLGFEGWMGRFVQATGYAGPLITVSDGIVAHEMGESEAHSDDHGHDSDHEHGGIDPHAWQSLVNGKIYVSNIASGLCNLDAAGCPTYTANADSYIAQLTALDAEIKTAIAAVPPEKRKLITTHDAFGYFGDAYGVTFLSPEGTSTEAEPSAADVARLITQIRQEGVSTVFIENMADSRLIKQIADETGATIGGELYADALSLPDGPAATYIDMFRSNAGLFIAAWKEK